ncbi:MAG: undecaprenyl/decaprenyl-phosphate alpha-N-acetylglucosaminyl 1-phosphate transferase [Candidatus Doudnabacteria bacterium]|nr:undecaprenyl/decaprenyl-phosphate alpha-N-acetylglucosaminyl 1-phosphate transferase [Candidatus Doudnabacteria bacterium]
MLYLLYFLISFCISLILVPLVKWVGIKQKIYDYPKGRKIHTTPTLLLGGLAIFGAFFLSLGVYLTFGHADWSLIPKRVFAGLFAGGVILMVGGYLDDKYNLPAKILWIFPALASLLAVAAGIGGGIKEISNPFGPAINLDYGFSFLFIKLSLSSVFVFMWLLGMIFTTKFLDGLDGLCSGIALIGGLTMFALSLLPHINQPITASLSIIFCGSIFGFLLYNFHPATVFLGESGSTFLGFVLGVLSVVLGGKIATALLVMGIPILDVAWSITRRIWYGRSPFAADRLHLHHRLLDIGFSQRQTVGFLWFLSAFFGFTAVFLQTFGKLIALLALFGVMVFVALFAVIIYKRQHPHIRDLFEKS